MKIKERAYQTNYSDLHPDVQYNNISREMKGKKIVAVLNDFCDKELNTLSLCEIGCSTGIQTNYISKYFKYTIGVDIDSKAISYAKSIFSNNKLEYIEADSMNLPFQDGSFDIVVCTHVYEHVPDPHKLISEIYRVLKNDGICYFAAGNRIQIIEPHYKLIFLSILPRKIANKYIHLFNKGNYYYERLLTLPSLRRLVRQFEIVDYTKLIIDDPKKYFAEDVLKEKSLFHFVVKQLSSPLYFFLTDYIWILRKC